MVVPCKVYFLHHLWSTWALVFESTFSYFASPSVRILWHFKHVIIIVITIIVICGITIKFLSNPTRSVMLCFTGKILPEHFSPNNINRGRFFLHLNLTTLGRHLAFGSR